MVFIGLNTFDINNYSLFNSVGAISALFVNQYDLDI